VEKIHIVQAWYIHELIVWYLIRIVVTIMGVLVLLARIIDTFTVQPQQKQSSLNSSGHMVES
jgi:hypothetical protein